MATFPLATIGPTIGPNGISAPSFSDIYQSLQASFQNIYGTDAYIDPDSQDGQLLAVFARGQHDANNVCLALYNSYSPSTAVGEALSSNVKINGIARKVATRSTAILTLTGVVGTTITNGVVRDTIGNRWALPESVSIPLSGSALALATCTEPGAVEASPNTINQIQTPTLGWQTATNVGDATPGAPVETDAELRIRQVLAVQAPSTSVLNAIESAISNLAGVVQARVYENDEDTTDPVTGLTPHSVSAVVQGGDPNEIADTIRRKKTPGAATFGTTVVPIADALGDVTNINFFEADLVTISVVVRIKARTGYLAGTADLIKAAVATYINDLRIGQRVDQGRLYLPAQLYGQGVYQTYEVNAVELARSPATPTNADVEIAFNELAVCAVVNVNVVVTP